MGISKYASIRSRRQGIALPKEQTASSRERSRMGPYSPVINTGKTTGEKRAHIGQDSHRLQSKIFKISCQGKRLERSWKKGRAQHRKRVRGGEKFQKTKEAVPKNGRHIELSSHCLPPSKNSARQPLTRTNVTKSPNSPGGLVPAPPFPCLPCKERHWKQGALPAIPIFSFPKEEEEEGGPHDRRSSGRGRPSTEGPAATWVPEVTT